MNNLQDDREFIDALVIDGADWDEAVASCLRYHGKDPDEFEYFMEVEVKFVLQWLESILPEEGTPPNMGSPEEDARWAEFEQGARAVIKNLRESW